MFQRISKIWIKTYILTIVLFIVIPYSFNQIFKENLIKYIFEKSDTYSNAKFVVDNNLQPEYVFMGSSLSRHSIIPSIISYKLGKHIDSVVNIGMNSATPYEMYLSFSKSKANFSNTKSFFYTIEPILFTRSYFLHKKYEKLLWSFQEWIYFSNKYNINNNYFNVLNLLSHTFGKSRSSRSDDNGYKKLDTRNFNYYTKENLLLSFTDDINKNFGISEFQINYLKKLKNEIENLGAKFIILYVPNHHSYYDIYNLYNQSFNELFSEKLNTAIGNTIQIGLFNPRPLSLKDSDYRDVHHLSHSGAIKFSIYLSHQLGSLSDLKPIPIKLPYY